MPKTPDRVPNLNPKFTITDAITGALTRIERVRGFLEAATLSREWVRSMSARALVLEAHHTTHIEGTKLTLDQSEKLLAGKKVPGTDPDDALELLNYRQAFTFVSEYLDSGAAITEGLIREIHKCLVNGVRGGSAAPGEYRRIQNYVVNSKTGEAVYTPPPAHDVPIMMSEMVTWMNAPGQLHPVLVSGVAQFQLVHIHPFLDGNGRVSRLLSTLCLYRAGYDFKRLFTISEYYDRDRTGFYSAIQGVREQDMDLTGWLEYFVEGLASQLAEVTQRGKKVLRRDALAREYGLTQRQALAVGLLLEQPELRIEDYEKLCPQVHRRTLQRELKVLLDRGILQSKGATHQFRYSLKIKGL